MAYVVLSYSPSQADDASGASSFCGRKLDTFTGTHLADVLHGTPPPCDGFSGCYACCEDASGTATSLLAEDAYSADIAHIVLAATGIVFIHFVAIVAVTIVGIIGVAGCWDGW